MLKGNTNVPEFTAGVRLSVRKDLPEAYARNAGIVADTFLRLIVDLSPVDTGRYVGSHQVTIGRRARAAISPQRAIARDTLSAGDRVIRRWQEKLRRTDLTQKSAIKNLFFTNLVPYAQRIEDGWSRVQAPAGVYRVAMAATASRARRLS